MISRVLAGPWGELRLAGASKGVSLSTTDAYTQLPAGTKHVVLLPRNFSTAVVAKVDLCPYLYVVKTADAYATGTDYSSAAQDGSTATSVVASSLDTLANGDALLIGSWMPFAGLHIDVDGANGNTADMAVHYWKAGATEDLDAWADVTPTDNTASGGVTLAQDGTVTWTVPTDWKPQRLGAMQSGMGSSFPYGNIPAFWVRVTVTAAMDSATTLDHVLAIPPGTPSEWTAGLVIEDQVEYGPGGFAAVRAATDAGTGNLIINCMAAPNSRFP